MSLYAYELELSSEMKIHSTFHISLLWFLKDNLISKQVLLSQFIIVENEENLYFVDLIDNMKWNTKFTQFELLIKWKKYEQRTWKSYTTIKKDTSALIKEFHQDHSSQSASTEWVKEENQQLLSDTWIMKWITKTERSWIRTWFWSWSKIMIMNMNTNWLHACEIWKFWNFWYNKDTVTELHSLTAWESWWNFQSVSWSQSRMTELIWFNDVNLEKHFPD